MLVDPGTAAGRSGSGATDNPFRFGGLYGYWRHMAEPVYVRARYLNVVLGRWLSRDPLPDRDAGQQAYLYAAGNPVTWVDPSGLRCVPSHIAGTGPVEKANTGKKLIGKGKPHHEGCVFHFEASWGLRWQVSKGDTKDDCRVYQFYNDGGEGWTRDDATHWPLPFAPDATGYYMFSDSPARELKEPMGFRGPLHEFPWSVQFVTCVCGLGDRGRLVLACVRWGFKFTGVMGQSRCAVKPFHADKTGPANNLSELWGLIPRPWGGGR